MISVTKPEQTPKSVVVSDQKSGRFCRKTRTNTEICCCFWLKIEWFLSQNPNKHRNLLVVSDKKSEGFCRKTRTNDKISCRSIAKFVTNWAHLFMFCEQNPKIGKFVSQLTHLDLANFPIKSSQALDMAGNSPSRKAFYDIMLVQHFQKNSYMLK